MTARHSPFFQHFEILDVGPFARDNAIALLTEESPRLLRNNQPEGIIKR